MRTIIIEGIRCFPSRQEISLAPLTLLVGENSTGKTTFLAATRIAWDLLHGKFRADFNEEPFNLGSYENIASNTSSRNGGSKSFVIGAETDSSRYRVGQRNALAIRLETAFRQEGSQPRVARTEISSGDYRLVASLEKGSKKVEYQLTIAGKRTPPVAIAEPFLDFAFPDLSFASFLFGVPALPRAWRERIPKSQFADFMRMLEKPWLAGEQRPYAMSPIRTKPWRTYDPRKEISRAEGGHVPMVLSRVLKGHGRERTRFAKALSAFGRASGLFDEVRVRRLGTKKSDPFQLEVRISGPAFNLVDVGYGVSQALPLVVDGLNRERGQLFLMQQPEVHLHPKAQAELGTFLAHLVKQDNKAFLVETHSDHLIDRVIMDVRDGKGLRHDQVVILYFQRQGPEVRIHPIHLDKQGNIVDAPEGYRSFFLDEERRFLGV